jgi:hypothetical protein
MIFLKVTYVLYFDGTWFESQGLKFLLEDPILLGTDAASVGFGYPNLVPSSSVVEIL